MKLDELLHTLIPKKPHSHHTTYDDYVAPATKSILDKLLEEFEDEILNVTMVDDEADFNPTKDLEELDRLLAKEPQSNFSEIHVHSVTINTEPFIHTQLMSPLYGVFKTSKPCIGRYRNYISWTVNDMTCARKLIKAVRKHPGNGPS
ncbi:hypothetical protein Tco_1124518 [Tanacetum coccineum]|uniref:Uncharacterized protein n=1 Tax=Tanacetum coccineum TaxID=301880 RepID=A0ABQ5J9E1_9ASTR